MTNAHGHDTTRNRSPRYIQVAQLPVIRPGITATSTASPTTIGVYILAKRVMKLSLRLLLSAAFSTKSRILETVDSANAFVVQTLSTPLRLTQPDRISSPLEMLRGTLSPVRATVSRLDLPSITIPSIGTFSPGRITIISPTFTLSGATVNSSPSRSTCAVSGRISIRCDMDIRLRPSATSSNISPIWKNSITNTASVN